MSNFKTFAQTLQGYAGTASVRFSASTADNLATITAAGYMNDKDGIVKANDIVEINYSDTTVLPAQITATYGEFIVVASGSNLNLVAYPSVGLLTETSVSVTVTAAALAGGANVPLIVGAAGQQYRLSDIMMSSGGTNFSGGGGDRNLSITDGTTVYTVIPAASLQTLANARWGSTAIPYPAAAGVSTLTVAGQNVRAIYSGGTADYTAGSVVLTLLYTRAV
jgi:hypothetical protein